MTQCETWLPVEGHAQYEVSNFGRVRRVQILKTYPHPKFGHRRVSIHYRKIFVHVLVLTAFVGRRPAGMVARHLDGDPSNNSVGNLAWGTERENWDDRERHGRTPRGARNGMAKFTAVQVNEIREAAATGESQVALAARFNVNVSTVWSIIHQRSYR